MTTPKISPELAAGIASQESRVAAYVASLGGYGARVTVRCGQIRTERTGTLARAATADQWPHVITDDGMHYVARPDAA